MLDRSLLRRILIDRFDESELKDLAFDLGVDYEMLPGDNKGDMARELVEYMERNGRLADLLRTTYEQRSNIPWPDTLENLLASLENRQPASPDNESPVAPATPLLWQTILSYVREQGGRFLREQGSTDLPNIFIPALYTRRTAVEEQLKLFLQNNKTALLLLGDPGVGKTNLLCQWSHDLLADNYGVFYYDCGGSIQLDIEHDIAQDLGLESPAQTLQSLTEIGQLATQEGRVFILIFDAINEFHQENQIGVGTLLKRLDAFIGRLPQQGIQVVFSCRTATWKQLERQNATQLLWHRYFQPATSQEPYLKLSNFDAEELATLYERYRQHFQLQTPFTALSVALRERLRNPLLLRMLAEAYRGRGEPIAYKSLSLSIFQRYYEERVRRRQDRLFVIRLAVAMLEQSRISLSLDKLADHPYLGPEILNETANSSYQRLLNEGVLSETSSGLSQDSVRFTYDQIGAYALAQHLLEQSHEPKQVVSDLVHENRDFPIAWETARILLLLQRDADLFANIAQSADVELREIAIDALTEMYSDEPEAVLKIIKQLLGMEATEAQKTGLKTAYYIGTGTRELFLWAATQDRPGLRRATKDVLYLIWRSDPDFTFNLLKELASHIKPTAIFNLRLILEFIFDLTITIYINHCDRMELAQQTSDLYYELATERLHMDLLDVGILGPAFEKIIFLAVSSAVGRPILETFYQTEVIDPDQFVDLSGTDKERLKRVLYLTEPGSDLAAAVTDLHYLLEAEIPFFNLLASIALATHAYDDFTTTRPLLIQLFDKVSGHGRLWLIQSFAVLLPDTPSDWVELLEIFTRRFIIENPETFYQENKGFLSHFDIVMLPLGLAYGKQGVAMPYFQELIREHLTAENWPQLGRCLAGLGAVGFYYPHAVLTMLQATISDFTNPSLQEALVAPLSMIRLLYLDEVDIFLQQIGANETLQRQVAAEASVEALSRYIYRLGIYNHTIRAAVHAPKIRRNFIIGGFEVLIDKTNPQEFIAYYAATAIRMAREAKYRLIEWTRPE